MARAGGRLLRLAGAAVALAAGAAAQAGAAPPQRPAEPGMNVQMLLAEPRSAWQAPLDRLAETQVRLARVTIPWDQIEPSPPEGGRHTYNWALGDSFAEELARRGLRMTLLLMRSPPWASSAGLLSPPDDPQQFAAFVAAAAERYGRGGTFWKERPELPALPVEAYEIWNEPNWEYFWQPAPDPPRFADLYVAARDALHRVDPRAVAITGGVTPAGVSFLEAALAARPGLAAKIDAVGYHPYARSTGEVVGLVAGMRRMLDAHGIIDAPIWITEYGWPTRGESDLVGAVAEADRAQMLVGVADELARSDCGVGGILPHTWVTREKDRRNPEDWYGLMRPNGTHTASSTSWADWAALVRTSAGALASASSAACGRDLRVQPLRRRARRGHACLSVRVLLAGNPAPGAAVTFRFRRAGKVLRRRERTSAAGTARGCLRERRQGRRISVVAEARRSDVAAAAAHRAKVRAR